MSSNSFRALVIIFKKLETIKDSVVEVAEDSYFCVLCRKKHKPYVGLIYTEHLQWAIDPETAEETIEEARRLWLDIIDNRETLENPYELDLPKDLAVSLASFFYIGNFPVFFKGDRIEIKFGTLQIVLVVK